ncbi:16S rRNA (guanine(527)-N(7))-methyltransferase RsmG [Colwellia sp. 4_MG-2023]|uniref:16S rRNA (guanine(527)-N(7))-methyltransferase RsmG n=1 Tax=unclassified Colwellia TaxID=196834 RepID=UPI001C0A0667|nr:MULTISPECIES: 16S rRNA (guanine(527)-N(7))-methyltransferase RsmG [unclassified Colwellia]MBU2923527.1 16S rRNA (guanine(527)-N(7))-methyltransferase RsmG [Colwellia sp. C2M11]MDO6486095.1 16S rRNA (guanine(527)-N(7))-methyltransferase RsmG [Colwellia sp. 6_MG-2023]MDO6505945.1 16S rRNA (guanine(527)-N(7))-methyltransferase RsmG [Colwellia sp. 5_MG-2023]MDO6554626.1 16S rRNA (guanine(527)-N(7))-methyltransferase RsmG [Colwellia sp. 4_MG-2023]MDO6653298.1 16S rRNA (guanine(527)-N(7))-methylt
MTLTSKLENLLSQTTLQVSPQQVNLLIQYVELLHKWNKAYNLTSVRDPQEMLVKHIMDSLMVGEVLHGKNFIDVGTGPGLPGIPLAILFPEKNFVLLDSLGKRITFLRQVVFQLKLTNVQPVKSRVEDYSGETPFDGVLSRAFSSLNDMVTWCSHLVTKEQGQFFALKGQYPSDELTNLPENISLVASHEIKVPELVGERHVLVLKKN